MSQLAKPFSAKGTSERRSKLAKGSVCGAFRDGKVRYARRAVAMFDCAVLRKQRPDRGLEVFRCPHCHQWHIGSTVGSDTGG